MKKLLMISVMLLVGALSVSSQTYYYKYLFSVDNDGAKYIDNMFQQGGYWTFANNIVYQSDKNGIKKQYSASFEYKGVKDGKNVYQYRYDYIYFNSDYSRMNYYHGYDSNAPGYWKESTQALDRTNGPEEQNAPIRFY